MAEPQPRYEQSDTPPEVRRVQYEIYRRMSPARKFRLVLDAYEMGKGLALAGLRMRHPEATDEQLRWLWTEQHLGRELFQQVYGTSAHVREA